MPTMAERSRASLEALSGSAMRCFHDHGYAATRVEDIVEGTGYTKGSFYHHFANKLDCFWRVASYREQQRGPWQELAFDFDPGSHRLEELLRGGIRHLAAAEQGAPRWPLVMLEVYHQHQGDPEVTDRLSSIYDRWVSELAVFVGNLEQAGWLTAGRDARGVARELLAYGQGLTIHAQLLGLAPTELEDIYVDGLMRLLSPGGTP